MTMTGLSSALGLADLAYLGEGREDVDKLYSEVQDYLGATMGAGAELKFPEAITTIRGQITQVARYIVESKDSWSQKYARMKQVHDQIMPQLTSMMDDLRRGPIMDPQGTQLLPPPVTVPRPGLPSEAAAPLSPVTAGMARTMPAVSVGAPIASAAAKNPWVIPAVVVGLVGLVFWMSRMPKTGTASTNPRRRRNPPRITTERELRREFWRTFPNLQRRKITDYSGKGKMYVTDTRVAFCDWKDMLQKDGEISQELAQRATL